MKLFLSIFAAWLVMVFLFVTFGGYLIFENIWLIILFTAFALALVTYIFWKQSEEIDQLKQRIEKLEKNIPSL